MSENDPKVDWVYKFYDSSSFRLRLETNLKLPDATGFNLYANTTGFGCLRCKTVHPLQPCDNCGSEQFILGLAQNGSVGIFCFRCQQGFTNYTCVKCGAKNPITHETILEQKTEKSGCFIATAVYGSVYANEVIYLSSFRDNVLKNYFLGKKFINLYYKISPFLASTIVKHSKLKTAVRIFLIKPIIRLIQYFKI